jgi:hypothetical protein
MRLGGDGASWGDLGDHLEALAENDHRRFWLLVEGFVEVPGVAAPAVWRTPAETQAVRQVVTTAIVGMFRHAEMVDDAAGVLAVVVRRHPPDEQIESSADPGDLVLLWSLAATWALAVTESEADRDG